MKSFPVAVATLAAVIVAGSWVSLGAGQQPQGQAQQGQPQLPGSPLGGRGEAVFPAVEGWGPHTDGTNTILVGYYNRNRDQTIDIPIGPNNRMDPGGPDMGQPTHFEPGRHYGVFSVQVPKDFGNKKISWTLSANGQSTTVQLSLNPPYWIDFFKNSANGNTSPFISFVKGQPGMSGPPKGYAQTLSATVNQPLPLTVWVSDKPSTYDPEEGLPENLRSGRGRGARGDAPPQTPPQPAAGAARGRGPNFDLTAAGSSGQPRGRGGRGGGPQPDATVTWKIHRAPGSVKFSEETNRLFNRGDINAQMEAATQVTFGAPGEYVVRAQVNDQSGDGGGGDQCCWTNALIKVNVK